MRAKKPEAAATWEPIDSIKPWDRNPMVHPEAQIVALVGEVKRDAWGAVIIAQLSSRRIIAGHCRLEAARRLGMDTVPVRFVDVDDHQADRMALADNKIPEMAEWDDEALTLILRDLSEAEAGFSGIGWSSLDLKKLLEEVPAPTEEEDTGPQLGGTFFKLIVECADEHQQGELLQRLEAEGFTCKLLMS